MKAGGGGQSLPSLHPASKPPQSHEVNPGKSGLNEIGLPARIFFGASPRPSSAGKVGANANPIDSADSCRWFDAATCAVRRPFQCRNLRCAPRHEGKSIVFLHLLRAEQKCARCNAAAPGRRAPRALRRSSESLLSRHATSPLGNVVLDVIAGAPSKMPAERRLQLPRNLPPRKVNFRPVGTIPASCACRGCQIVRLLLPCAAL
jgi:hypothetical protein